MTKKSTDDRKDNKLFAKITNVFSSIQGEGPFVGFKQIFIRFAECNLSCVFCDTCKTVEHIYTHEELVKKIQEIDETNRPHHSISLTGGEPLFQYEFLEGFLPKAKKEFNLGIYLETNGIFYNALEKIIKHIDIISMDFKLPSATKEKEYWKEHEKFLEVAVRKKVFVKLVITADVAMKDIEKSVDIVNKINKNITVVVQPAAKTPTFLNVPDTEFLLNIFNYVHDKIKNARLIPQVHKIIPVI